MKKLPLALSALAILTTNFASITLPAYAAPGDVTIADTEPFNVGQYDDWEFMVKDIYPQRNAILFEIKAISVGHWEPMAGQGKISFLGLGPAEKRNYADEAEADRRYLMSDEAGWAGGSSEMLLEARYELFGVNAEMYTEIPMGVFTGEAPGGADLMDNTSGVLYYRVERGENFAPLTGKIDYSMCYNSKAFQEALPVTPAEENLNCTIVKGADGGYYYRPNLGGIDLDFEEGELEELEAQARARLTYVLVEEEQTETGSETSDNLDSEAGGSSGDGTSSDDITKTEVGQGSIDGNGAGDVANDVSSDAVGDMTRGAAGNATNNVRYAYATVTNEGSAYQNSENTGVTDEYATDADAWAVDDSKVWEDGADTETVETPELGEEDCGHFWPLMAGWGLAVLGWGSVVALYIKQRK